MCQFTFLSPIYPPRGSGEASDTYTFLSATSPRYSVRQSAVFLMSSPSTPALQQLHSLERSSPDFHDQLCSVLYGEEYMQCVSNLEDDDLAWLVDYLDKVRHWVARPHPPLRLA